MRYASIRSMDISNGAGLGIALFVQGCHFHCINCFNKETWDFNGGKEWIKEIEDDFINLLAANRYIDRVSILGGEPLCNENIPTIFKLIKTIKLHFPKKQIWCYTGYTWEQIFNECKSDASQYRMYDTFRQDTVRMIDILVDGQYVDKLRDLSLAFRGSSNQRVIDVQKSLYANSIVVWKQE